MISSQRPPGADLLRIIACFLVIVAHTADPFIAQVLSNPSAFAAGSLMGSLARPCIPLLAMVTGIILFPVKDDMLTFYKKKLSRIIIPFLFWSLTLPLLFYIYLTFFNPGTTNPAIDLSDYASQTFLAKIETWDLNFTIYSVPLRYTFILIGIYLIAPVFGAWVKQASRKDLKLFLGIWLLTLFLPYLETDIPALLYLENYAAINYGTGWSWTHYGTFYYFSGFIGYPVLAYYWHRYPLNWSWTKLLLITGPMFVTGFIITYYGFMYVGEHLESNFQAQDIIWLFTGINVFLMTAPLFLAVQKIPVKSSKTLSRAAQLTFGVFLCHFIFAVISFDIFGEMHWLPVPVRILSMAAFTFMLSYLLTFLLSRSRFTRRFIM